MAKEKSMFESYDSLMAEVLADLPGNMGSNLLLFPHAEIRRKMKKRVLALAEKKGITLTQDEIPE